jgi:hypothetical protein
VNLGVMYANGRGVAKDEVRAFAWFDVAANASNLDATRNRGALAESLTPEQRAAALTLSSELMAKVKRRPE